LDCHHVRKTCAFHDALQAGSTVDGFLDTIVSGVGL
jgi:hypothetical protein